jgi:hypothetical protein
VKEEEYINIHKIWYTYIYNEKKFIFNKCWNYNVNFSFYDGYKCQVVNARSQNLNL